MARTILVPLDGSSFAEAILPQVSRVLPSKGKLYLAQLIPSGSPDAGTKYLEEVRRRVFPGSSGIDLVRTGKPADGILRIALEKNIDLIAMTTHARTGLKGRLMGSVAAEVVRKSQLPVLLTRPDVPAPGPAIRRILVPVEGAEPPSDLLGTLKLLSPGSGVEIILLRVLAPVNDPAPLWAMDGDLSLKMSPERRLQELADTLEDEGFTVWPMTSVGRAEEEILIQGKKLGVDLIAMATHGRAGLDRILEGSVSEKVLHRSPVAVLLQKPLVVHRKTVAGETHA